jgi:amidohydrolase
MIIQSILQHAANLNEELISIRRHMHKHPELSEQERETMNFISTKLTQYGIEHSCNVGGFGITGILKGELRGDKVLMLRADTDALPIDEKNQVPYSSVNKGVMHACGHDVHSTCLLGALNILNQNKHQFAGSIKFVFQPAEEKLPGGATRIIASGFLENPKPDAALALHVFPALEAGEVGFRSGMYMASCDEIYLNIKGKGGHAAILSEINNPLYIAAELLGELEKLSLALQQATVPTILSFGSLQARGATNVVPDECTLSGTFRTMNEEWRFKCHKEILELIKRIEKKRLCEIVCKIETGYPFLINDEAITAKAKQAAVEYLGVEKVKELEIRMASEDFAYYSQRIPSCFFRLGTGNKAKGITSPVHTSTFDIDETALVTGAGLLSFMAIRLLSE